MEIIEQRVLIGERALFKSRDLEIINSIFKDGESPFNLINSQATYLLWMDCNEITPDAKSYADI